MRILGDDYRDNVAFIDGELRVDKSFDVLNKKLKIGKDELTLYYIDGFVKDAVMQKLMLYFVSLKGLPNTADDFVLSHVTYVETDITEDVDLMIQMVMSGATLVLGSKFGRRAIIIDTRTYPARDTQEPEGAARRFCGNAYFQYRACSQTNQKSCSDYELYNCRTGFEDRCSGLLYGRQS